MTNLILEIKNLSVIANTTEKVLVNDVSFKIEQNEIIALVGESGSGKTMTSAAIMDLLPHGTQKTKGTILISGVDTNSWSAEKKRSARNTLTSIVMQNPMSAFDPVLTIFYHFKETIISHNAGETKKTIREKSENALVRVGFPNPSVILDLYPFQMSGGMLQRVMLAIALLSSPPLIIADEATTDLDLVSQKKILELLKEHCTRNNSSLLLITHDLGVAASLANKVILMKNGKIAALQQVKEFFTSPQNDYAKQLISCHHALYTDRYNKIMEIIGGDKNELN
ncbi:MAG: ABC transporter ATP-binding protein [Termitinemataceae bacterium]|nr:MAG: ABC transporter ATP-binding protein [Termitinemataceae bacterium]